MIKKTDACAKNLKKSLSIKTGEHVPCGYSISTIQAFDNIENKHSLYHGWDMVDMLYLWKNILRKVC